VHVRDVVKKVEGIVRMHRSQPEAFAVTHNLKGEYWIQTGWEGHAFLDLLAIFCTGRSQATQIDRTRYQFHPHFNLFLDEAERGIIRDGWERVQQMLAPQDWSSAVSLSRAFLGHPGIDGICTELNALLSSIFQKTQNTPLLENIKSFERAAKENRKSLMQYAAHLIKDAPATRIAGITITGTEKTGFHPISHNEICVARKELVRYLKKKVSPASYLGYSVLLRHEPSSGYRLDAFIFLSDDVLNPAAKIVSELAAYWNGRIGSGRTECAGRLREIESLDHLYADTLKMLTIATEPNFYCRVAPPNRAHQFWLSQSPTGKLTARTRSRKRSAAAAEKREGISGDVLLDDLKREERLKEELRKSGRWQELQAKHSQKRSARNQKGAKHRLKAKKAPDDVDLLAQGCIQSPARGRTKSSPNTLDAQSDSTAKVNVHPAPEPCHTASETPAHIDPILRRNPPREVERIDKDGNRKVIQVEVRKIKPVSRSK
jgi:hypothetical protein